MARKAKGEVVPREWKSAEELDRDLRFSLTGRKAIVATFIFAGPPRIEIGHEVLVA